MEPMKQAALSPAPDADTALQLEDKCTGPSSAKRLCLRSAGESNSTKHSTTTLNNEADATILSVLNADCWRLVLDQLSINDVVRSERVSRAWQRIVLEYLAGVQNYWVMDVRPEHYTLSPYTTTSWYKHCRIIRIPRKNVEVFKNMMRKMGPFFVSMSSRCIIGEMLEIIADNCPNLRDLKIRYYCQPSEERGNIGLFTKCKHLKRVTFNVSSGSDILFKEIVTSETLEELTISGATAVVSGRFLNHLRTYNLKTLGFILCKTLRIENVVSAVNNMTGLTRLVLCKNPLGPLRDVHLLLDELPNLEHLSLNFYNETHAVNEVAEAIGRLRRLRELNLWGSKSVTDEWLEAAARGCPGLRAVNAGRTRATGRGLRALCLAAPLRELGAAELAVTDAELEACARGCRGLERLDAWRCGGLTPRLPARLAWPRARPLRLRLHRSLEYLDCDNMVKNQVRHEGLILLWDSIDYYSRLKPI